MSKDRRDISKLMSQSINVFPAKKSLVEVTYTEGSLEADLCYHLEFDQNVISYEPQPPKISYLYQDGMHEYTADFKVTYLNGSVRYIEIKFVKDILRIKGFGEWKSAIRNALNYQGFEFKVLTEDFIREEPLYGNLILLWSSNNKSIESDFLLRIIKTLDQFRTVPISSLLSEANYESEFEQIYRLIFEQRIEAPITSELLSIHTLIKHSGESYECYL